MAEKQGRLPGVLPKQIPAIEDAADELRKLRKKRQALAALEEEAQQKLRDLLKEHRFTAKKPYIFESEEDGEVVKLDAFLEKAEDRAFVRKHKDPKAEEGEEPPTEE
jgi:hypothetical protein